ncbi:hypothetical protein AQUCO_00500084v1 [Aquilegia coerulea]|uniref:Uncharacterized protein n=1 Tax=Aquilegia coerulea TaxID=218851 RepID=A0A2G5EQ88_AQUCA|nr:hypothetical protein AQUCO_00500084v1 [Aquilegia coerulea]
MGNCFRHEPSTIWAGEDWSSVISQRTTKEEEGSCNKKMRNLTAKEESAVDIGNVSSTTKLKIRLTKKQLQELLSRVEVEGLSVEQVLFEMVDVSDEYHIQYRSCKPALPIISEEPNQ